MKLFLLLILPFCLISSGWAARRALVIGNAGYSDSPLRNPVNDANLVANTLRQLGFEVSLITNADHQKMDTALNTFVGSIRDEDEVLFYYSGHGANYAGENFLIPIGRVINAEEELRYHAFSSNLALERMQRARLSIMVLDACRDNPFRGARSGNKGLQIMQGKAGSQYIIYSTEQGKTAADGTGANSPFTESFVKHIGNSDRIEDIMKKVTREVKTNTFDKQIPWTAGNLIEDFYFAKAAPGTPATTKPAIKVDTEYTTGSIRVESNTEGEIWIDGSFVANISSGMIQTSSRIGIGSHSVELKYQGKTQSRTVSVLKDQTSEVVFAIVKAGENMDFSPCRNFWHGLKGWG
ncbi:MAG: caspase family protein [Candidatus Cloacimonadaceae bacterium]|nr:caspase family protein [Candidatus Cloacimonadaceae bacterium]